MADTSSVLEQLADISEPPMQLGFALAPLWWLLIALSLSTLVYLVLRAYRRWRYFAAKRQAIQLLQQLSETNTAANSINQLIKRVLQHYQPAHPALTMPVALWQRWLDDQLSLPLPNLSVLLYQQGENQQATAQFREFANAWLTNYKGNAPLSMTHKTEDNHA